MSDSRTETLIEPIRASSRQLVRELGFMETTLAGTRYPPSAVHALIEIERTPGISAAQLCETLKLDQTTARQTVYSLVGAGEVERAEDKDNDTLHLTARGKNSLNHINVFARDQVCRALERITYRDAEAVLSGLQIYAASLSTTSSTKGTPAPAAVEIVRGYTPGLIGRALEMHAVFYSALVGFGAFFEASLAKSLGDIVSRLDNPRNEAWVAKAGEKIVGTVFVDGEHLGHDRAHLRAFIVDTELHGAGVGRRLLESAMEFIDETGFEETHLWTFHGLNAARRLYEKAGFELKEERRGEQWGKEVTEQLFVRKGRAMPLV